MADNQINSFYDLEDLSDDQLKSLKVESLRDFLAEAKAEQKELNSKYLNGDRDMYPPDWYDYYVHPINCIINKIQDFLDSLDADDDSEEDSEW